MAADPPSQVLLSGIALPKAYLRKEALSLTVLLVGVMTAAWVRRQSKCSLGHAAGRMLTP
jgi:hypothetical protein